MKKIILTKCISIMLISLIILSVCGCIQNVKQKNGYDVIYVGKTKDVKYNTIQEAIDSCNDNALIYVLDGYYVENIIIHKSIKLIGENSDNIIIDGGFQSNVIEIISDNVSITNISIQNSNPSPYNIDDTSGILIKSENVTVKNCLFEENIVGIKLITSNNIIEDCFFQNNSYGIYTVYAKNNIIANSTFLSNSKYGIYVYIESNFNIIKENSFYDNSYGVRIRAENNSILRNVFKNNQRGLYVCCDSNYNKIFQNNFINNSIYNGKGNYHQNTWYYDNHIGGNFWSDYKGVDYNMDKIGDSPYIILSRKVNGTAEVIEDIYPIISPISLN